MENLSDEFLKSLGPPTAPKPAAPALTQPIYTPEQVQVEGGKTKPLQGSRTVESQTKEFGGVVGSPEYYKFQGEHPYRSFLGRNIFNAPPFGELGAALPTQEVWDTATTAEKALLVGTELPGAIWRTLKSLPRETVKAVATIAIQSAVAPVETLTGRSTREDKPVELPWVGAVPTWAQTDKELEDAGYSRWERLLMVGNKVVGDATISSSLVSAAKSAYQPRTQVKGIPVINVKDIDAAMVKAEGQISAIRKKYQTNAAYRTMDKTTAKKYGGSSGDTFFRVTPASPSGDLVEIAVVQKRTGVGPRIVDKVKGTKTYEGQFGLEIKLESQIVPVSKAEVAPTIEPFSQPKGAMVQTETFLPETPSRFNSSDDLIREINKPKEGKQGLSLHPDEMRQVAELFKDSTDQVNKELRGGIYTRYGGGKDVILGSVDGPTGRMYVVAELDKKTGNMNGRVRIHGTPIKVSELEGRIGEGTATPSATVDVEAAAVTIKPGILKKPLKGQENRPINPAELDTLSQLVKETNLDPEVSYSIMRAQTGKSVVGDLTHAEYVQVSQAVQALGKVVEPQIGGHLGLFKKWFTPQRHWTRDVERETGIPLYSQVYVPMEESIRHRNVFRDTWRSRAREALGDFAKSGFAEERRLLKNYLEGDEGAIIGNAKLAPEVQTSLVAAAEKFRGFYNELFDVFGLTEKQFLKNYQSHLQDLGGVFQLYKEGAEIPKELTAFFEKQRKGGLGVQVDDALALFDIYTNAGSNKMFLNPALKHIHELYDALTPNIKNSVKEYVQEKLGYAGEFERHLDEAVTVINKKYNKDFAPDAGRQVMQIMFDSTYSGAMGLSPSSVAKNMLQFQQSYMRLGPRSFGSAIAKALTKEGRQVLRDEGFLVELGTPHGRELVKEQDATGAASVASRKLTQATLKPYSLADDFSRAVTYWQWKLQWDESFAKYSQGKLTWDGLEKDLDFSSFDPIDQQMIRQRLAAGDQKGAFDHAVREIIDEVQFPYRRGASARATFGAGKIVTQFAQWPIEYGHMLKRWAIDAKRTGDFSKLIRWHATNSLTVRTLNDAFGIDASKWLGLNPLKPTPAPAIQAVQNLAGMMEGWVRDNAEIYEQNKDELVRQLFATLPVGVEANRLASFNRSFKDGPKFDGKYAIRSTAGKVIRYGTFADLWLSAFGFYSPDKTREAEINQNMRNDVFYKDKIRARVMELLQQGKQEEANALIKEFNINTSGFKYDSYFIPRNQRLFKTLPPELKGKYAPQVFPKE